VVALGGTVVLCETTELIGAEHILAEQAESKEVKEQLLKAVASTEAIICALGLDLRGTQPGLGNMAGGLTTIEEKSIGCVCKGGTSPLVEVVDYACRPTRRGLVMMDTPGNDMEAVTGLVAGGAQVIAFTTGCGTPTGSALAPVIKICGNPMTSKRMAANIDVDVSGVITSGKALEEAGERLFQEIVAVLNGKLTKAEVLGHRELAISRIHQSF
jgi:altronate dehydratase large subunit